jgi:hypothetical protein
MKAERTRSNDKRLPDANGCKGKRRLVREDVPGVRGLVAGENLRGLGKRGGKKRSIIPAEKEQIPQLIESGKARNLKP